MISTLNQRWWIVGASVGLTATVLALAFSDSGPVAAGALNETVFPMREVSVFDLEGDRSENANFLRGMAVECVTEASKEAKAYPAFKSARPLYGTVTFGAEYGQPDSGTKYNFALDESRGTGKGYDRLYFDRNRDGDLRNDPALKPQAKPPGSALWHDSSLKQQVIFDWLPVDFQIGPEVRPVRLMPRFTSAVYPGSDRQYDGLTLVRTDLREGEITIAGRKYMARLGNDYGILGRLDLPGTALSLMARDSRQSRIYWWGGDRLMGMHKIKGKYYSLASNPRGTELRVREYTGPLGGFRMGVGTRKLDPGSVWGTGSLEAPGRAVAVGAVDENGFAVPEALNSLPVGDYLPTFLNVRLGRLQVSLSQNYHSDGRTQDRNGRARVYGIRIKEDQPYVFDFSGKPEVMFASPSNALRIKRGDELQVKAVLIDPALDVMIRGINDTTRKQNAGEGPNTYQRDLSLDPIVVITRATGEKVAEGTMPFG